FWLSCCASSSFAWYCSLEIPHAIPEHTTSTTTAYRFTVVPLSASPLEQGRVITYKELPDFLELDQKFVGAEESGDARLIQNFALRVYEQHRGKTGAAIALVKLIDLVQLIGPALFHGQNPCLLPPPHHRGVDVRVAPQPLAPRPPPRGEVAHHGPLFPP